MPQAVPRARQGAPAVAVVGRGGYSRAQLQNVATAALEPAGVIILVTAAGLIAALLGDVELTAPMRALLVVAIAAGATIASHVNDSGFWLVNRYLGLSVPQTLGTWTVTGTIIAFVSLALTLALGALLG